MFGEKSSKIEQIFIHRLFVDRTVTGNQRPSLLSNWPC